MDYKAWSVDLTENSATHTSGFTIVIEGSPLSPMGVNPGRFPEGLSAVQQATLLRSGLEAMMREAKTGGAIRMAAQPPKPKVPTPKPKRNPSRPVLSLKR